MGKSVMWWLSLFYMCHEWHTDGGRAKSKTGQTIRTGYWHLLEHPCDGGVLEQPAYVGDIFNIIIKTQAERVANNYG